GDVANQRRVGHPVREAGDPRRRTPSAALRARRSARRTCPDSTAPPPGEVTAPTKLDWTERCDRHCQPDRPTSAPPSPGPGGMQCWAPASAYEVERVMTDGDGAPASGQPTALAGRIVTMDKARTVIENGVVYARDGSVVDVRP